MTKQEMISEIYEAMADKTSSEGCIIETALDRYILSDYMLNNSSHKIIGHPVRIGDVLKYIDTHNCFIDVEEGYRSRDMEALDSMLRQVFYAFVGKQDRPIDEQDDSCVDFVYSLVKN